MKEIAEFGADIIDATGGASVGDVAKLLSDSGVEMGEQKLFQVLASRGWVYRHTGWNRWRVTEFGEDGGYVAECSSGGSPQVRITLRGLGEIKLAYGVKAINA
ncbi:phage antirepressor KilAC domain-containing protein [Nocardia goodfellowii]